MECKDVLALYDSSMGLSVLIETSWNVKLLQTLRKLLCGSCINRNIVECKESKLPSAEKFESVLIETSWNVKKNYSLSAVNVPGINRNIVECKDHVLSRFSYCCLVLIETSWNVKLSNNFKAS